MSMDCLTTPCCVFFTLSGVIVYIVFAYQDDDVSDL